MTSLDNAHGRIARKLLATRGPSGRVISDDQFHVLSTLVVAAVFLAIWGAMVYVIWQIDWSLEDVRIAQQWVPRLIISAMTGVGLGMAMHWLKIPDAAESLVHFILERTRCGLPLNEEKAIEIERLCRLPEPHAFFRHACLNWLAASKTLTSREYRILWRAYTAVSEIDRRRQRLEANIEQQKRVRAILNQNGMIDAASAKALQARLEHDTQPTQQTTVARTPRL